MVVGQPTLDWEAGMARVDVALRAENTGTQLSRAQAVAARAAADTRGTAQPGTRVSVHRWLMKPALRVDVATRNENTGQGWLRQAVIAGRALRAAHLRAGR